MASETQEIKDAGYKCPDCGNSNLEWRTEIQHSSNGDGYPISETSVCCKDCTCNGDESKFRSDYWMTEEEKFNDEEDYFYQRSD